MRANQLTKGLERRVMYVENKNGEIDGVRARVGWVSFSKSGRTVYYRGLELARMKGGGVRGNYLDVDTNDEYWVSGVKKKGSNAHWAETAQIEIDEDAMDEYNRIRGNRAV